jgi:hypothetical protein
LEYLTLRRVALDRPITVRAVFLDLDFEPPMILCPVSAKTQL